MVVGMRWFFYVEGLNPVAYGDVGDAYNSLNFTKTQPFKVELQCFGNIVLIDLFAYFVYRKEILAFLTQIPLFTIDYTAFYYVVILASRAH